MAKTKVSEWSSTAASNTDVNGINIAEGMLPSDVNNAIREIMAQLKNLQAGLSGDSLTVGGNLSVTGAITGNITGNVTGDVTGNATNITGVATVPHGGTGATTLTGMVKGNGTSAFTAAVAGSDYADIQTAQTFTAPQRGAFVTMITLPFNLASRNNFEYTTTGSSTFGFSGGSDGQSGYIILDNTGGYAISLGTEVRSDTNFASTLSSSGVYLISYILKNSKVYCTTSNKLS